MSVKPEIIFPISFGLIAIVAVIIIAVVGAGGIFAVRSVEWEVNKVKKKGTEEQLKIRTGDNWYCVFVEGAYSFTQMKYVCKNQRTGEVVYKKTKSDAMTDLEGNVKFENVI